MNYKTLVIAPHCDDEVLGCGGIIANRRGDVFVYYLGIDVFHIVRRSDREAEVKNVADFLGFQYRIGNNLVNNYKRETLINEITDVINEICPQEIFIPNSSYNQDHKEAYDACMVALRPHDINWFVPKVFVYEVDQYLLWGDYNFEPNYFESINVDDKVSAYKKHSSQVRGFRPASLILAIAHVRGLSCGFEHAEGFKILRYVKQ